MKFTTKILGLAFSAAALCMTACTSEKQKMEEHHFGNKLYINVTNNTEEILVKPAAANVIVTRQMTAGTALKAENKITARFVADTNLLKDYHLSHYDDKAIALPAEMCTIEDADVLIEKGAVASAPATVIFSNLQELDREKVYVMPVAIRDVNGIEALESKTVVYYVFKGSALINVVANIADNRAWPDFNNDSKFNNLTNFTMEALIRPNAFGRQISTIMGIEGNFLLRIGDAGVPDNQLQIASNRNNTNSDLQFETGKWYHIACAFDNGYVTVYINGSEKLSNSHTGRYSVSLGRKHTNESDGSRCFWIGYSYSSDRYFDGDISEVRIWNRTLTKDEINAPSHFYSVDPASEGLISYWKFDEEAGDVIKDHSASGYDLTCEKTPKWTKVSLP